MAEALESRCLSQFTRVKPCKNVPPPGPRSGHRCVCDESNLYVFGGFHPKREKKIIQELWRFNFATQMWYKLLTNGDFPLGTASSSVILIGTYLVVFGGSVYPFSATESTNLHVCDLRERRWKAIEGEGSKPAARYGQSAVLSPQKDKLFIYGGTNGYFFFSTVNEFDFRTNEWSNLTFSREASKEVPSPRYRHEAVEYEGKCYIFGGGTTNTLSSVKKIHVFDLAENCWEVITSIPSQSGGYPERRLAHSCVRCGHLVYICGGYDHEEVFDDVWTFNLKSFHWNKLKQTLPVPTYFHSAALTPAGCLYIFGGTMSDVDGERTNSMYRIWLKVPSLTEISWESVMSSIQHKEGIDAMTLARLGVPHHLLSRLR